MATYYAFYICNSPSPLPHFYSNEAPSFPGEFLTFTGGVDPDYIGNCYRVEIITKDPPSYVIIDWNDPGTTYFTFDSCAACELGEVVQILENCDDPLDIICLQNYLVVGSFVVYNNKCYQVKEVPSCNATVPITFSPTSIYKSCLSCKDSIPPVNYKLIDCETGEETYTSTDLSLYVGQVIKIDGYDNCYRVEIVQDIPFGTDVVVTESFASCELCNSDYYLLSPCDPNSELDPIITYTDLSAYVGDVIRLETCPEICWSVTATDANLNPAEVTVINDYENCNECLIDVFTPICITFTNTYNNPVGITYIDINGNVQKSNLSGKGVTPKTCALWWSAIEGVTITQYGNCINGECPPPPQPKRRVTPGYDTPACSTDYYEKVECTYSELMYKQVLSERYGITNCCPEEDMKWIIKHEMLMLDILVNPDYECTPTTSCDCPVIGGTVLSTICPDVTRYIIERCDLPGSTEVVVIDNQYDVLGNVIIIDDVCYIVVEPTNRLATAYWTPGTIYENCGECLPPITLPCEDCIKIIAVPSGGGAPVELVLPPSGTYNNGTYYYYFTIDGVDYEIYNETWNTTDPAGTWLLYAYDTDDDIGSYSVAGTCPIGAYTVQASYFDSFIVDYCGGAITGYVLYSVSLDTQGNQGVYFTYLDCNNILQQYDLPSARGTTNVYVCSTPGRLPGDFVAYGGVNFNVVETTVPCNC